MIVNCGFELKAEKRFIYKNKQNVYIPNNLDTNEIRKKLLEVKPDDRNWQVTGWAIISE